jgi:uncharacterized protein
MPAPKLAKQTKPFRLSRRSGRVAAVFLLLLSGCEHIEVRSRYPEGSVLSEDVFRSWGPRDSLHRIRQQTYFFNGNHDFVAAYRRGEKHGKYRDYWHNGQIKSEGRYEKGKRQGTWNFFWNRYQLSSKGQYRDDLKQGPWIEYFENGELRRRGSYEMGRETGAWEGFNHRGDRLWWSSCFPANDTGSFRGFFANGETEESYKCLQGMPFGRYEKRWLTGGLAMEGQYDSSGRKLGIWSHFFPEGELESRQVFLTGKWHDSILFYDSLGALRQYGRFSQGTGQLITLDSSQKVKEVMPYLNGLREGEALSYFANGGIAGRLWYAGDTLQELTYYHENGKISQHGRLVNGKRDSLWVRYHRNGKKAEETPYVKGVMTGVQTFFDSLEHITQQLRYEHGYPAEGRFKGVPGIGPKIQLGD